MSWYNQTTDRWVTASKQCHRKQNKMKETQTANGDKKKKKKKKKKGKRKK